MMPEPFICEKCGKGPEDHWLYVIAGADYWELVICGKPPEDMPRFHVQSNAGFNVQQDTQPFTKNITSHPIAGAADRNADRLITRP